jgi:hypothetical protein
MKYFRAKNKLFQTEGIAIVDVEKLITGYSLVVTYQAGARVVVEYLLEQEALDDLALLENLLTN